MKMTVRRLRSIIAEAKRKKSGLASRLGKCYQAAGTYASSHPEATLVHGSIQGFNYPRIDHAWVELPDGSVYEAVWDTVLSKQAFDGVFHPIVKKKYSHDEALVHMVKSRHWGPWSEDASEEETA